ncbi:MAG: FliG C-terminal domain-containing protein [Magnetovibrionaceae bacterium]
MRLDVTKKSDGSFEVLIGQTKLRLHETDIKHLLVLLTGALVPGAEAGKSADERAHDFVERLKTTEDVAIQNFLRAADEKDVLILLKIAERDEKLGSKLYANMTERSAKLFREDLQFAFRDGVGEGDLVRAMGRMMGVVERLEAQGRFS